MCKSKFPTRYISFIYYINPILQNIWERLPHSSPRQPLRSRTFCVINFLKPNKQIKSPFHWPKIYKETKYAKMKYLCSSNWKKPLNKEEFILVQYCRALSPWSIGQLDMSRHIHTTEEESCGTQEKKVEKRHCQHWTSFLPFPLYCLRSLAYKMMPPSLGVAGDLSSVKCALPHHHLDDSNRANWTWKLTITLRQHERNNESYFLNYSNINWKTNMKQITVTKF